MISVKDAIESGAWYHCQNDEGHLEFNCRIRIMSFAKAELSEDEMKGYFDAGGSLWLMDIQLVSLNKGEQLEPEDIHNHIYLRDQDQFRFEYLFSNLDSQIFFDEKWAEKLRRFSFSGANFRPKTKSEGIIAFFLPDDDQAEYYIGVVDGTIAEV